MTTPLDLIVTPRSEITGTQAPKSGRTAQEPADRFADRLHQDQTTHETSEPHDTRIASRRQDEGYDSDRDESVQPRSNQKESDIKTNPEDATPIRPDQTIQPRSQQEKPEHVTATLSSEGAVTVAPQTKTPLSAVEIIPTLITGLEETSVATQIIGEATLAPTSAPVLEHPNTSQDTQSSGQNLKTPLNAALPTQPQGEPSAQLTDAPDIRTADTAQTPAIVPSQVTPTHSEQIPSDTRALLQESNQQTLDSAHTALTKKPTTAIQNTIPAEISGPALPVKVSPDTITLDSAYTALTKKPTTAIQNTIPAEISGPALLVNVSPDTISQGASHNTDAKPAVQNITPLPTAQQALSLSVENAKPDGVVAKTEITPIPVDGAIPIDLNGTPQTQSTSIQTGKPAPHQPKQIVTPVDDASEIDPVNRASLAKSENAFAGKAVQAENQKGNAQTHQTTAQVSDKPNLQTAQTAQTDTLNTQNMSTRARLPAQSHLLGTPPEQQAHIEIQPGSSLTLGVPAPGERPLSLDQAQTIRLNGTAGAASLPVKNIAVQMSKNFKSGANRFEIRIDPPEMGRIHVRMEMTHDGRVQAILSAERSDTLDLLQRDAKLLSQSLDEAGLDVDSDSLQFSLHDESGHPSFSKKNHALNGTLGQEVQSETTDRLEVTTTPVMMETYGFKTSSTAGINIQV